MVSYKALNTMEISINEAAESSNRTFMELKSNIAGYDVAVGDVLIAPLWN